MKVIKRFMIPSLDRTWLLTSARALLAFVALGVVAPGLVHASCGDYLTAVAHAHFSPSPAVTLISLQDNQLPLPLDHVPCSGPYCSQRKSEPLSIPISPVQVSLEHWVWLNRLPTTESPGSDSWVVPLACTISIRDSGGIYHPPRAVLLISH
jgi:hypothetical protein